MRKHFWLSLTALLVTVFSAAGSPAVTTVSVSIVNAGGSGDQYDPALSPHAPFAASGETITWTNNDAGSDGTGSSHALQAYYPSAVFASPVLSQGQSFSFVYGGGTILYRCLYHSSLSNDLAQGPPVCLGMCGAIYDGGTPDTTPPQASITTPSGYVFTGGVRIDGVASDNNAVVNVLVKITPIIDDQRTQPYLGSVQGYSERNSPLSPCTGCDGPYAAWTYRQRADVQTKIPPLTLPPGQYRVDAAAFDPQGNRGDATPISIYVLR